MEICPDNAISLNPGPIIDSSCTECRLCQQACPTEVFRDELHTESYLSDRAASFLGSTVPTGQEATLFIHCHQALPQSRDALSPPCLAGISENILLSAALSGFEEIRLIKGVCSRCRLSKGEPQFRDLIRSAKLLLESTGLGEVAVNLETRQKGGDAVLARKSLLAAVASRVRHHTASVLYCQVRPAEGAPGRRRQGAAREASPKRAFLRRLLAHVSMDELREVRREPAPRWGNIAIDEQKCSACGICVEVCPTEALEQRTEGGCWVLSFVSTACTKCSLCIEACPEDAIVYEAQWSLADLMEDSLRVLARIELAPCVVCGELTLEGQGQVCTTCEKREAWRCM